MGVYGVLSGLYWDSGKENGNYYNGLYEGCIGISALLALHLLDEMGPRPTCGIKSDRGTLPAPWQTLNPKVLLEVVCCTPD